MAIIVLGTKPGTLQIASPVVISWTHLIRLNLNPSLFNKVPSVTPTFHKRVSMGYLLIK